MSRGKSQLFLTLVDPHKVEPLNPEHLRSYIIMHSLFFDQLLVGDSQLNNNWRLRYLIYPNEPMQQIVQEIPRDLFVFLREGYLLPAIRDDYESLIELRKEHARRYIVNVPSLEFVEFVEAQLKGRRATYSLTKVSQMFRERSLRGLDSPDVTGKGRLSKKVVLTARSYIEGQDVLFWKSLRDWLSVNLSRGLISERQYSAIDKIIASAYLLNVPLSMGSTVDVPICASRDPYPVDLRFGSKMTYKNLVNSYRESKELELPTMFFLSHRFLKKIPAEALIHIKGSQDGKIKPSHHYAKISKQFERFRAKGQVDLDTLCHDLHFYFGELDTILTDHLLSSEKSFYLQNRKKVTSRAYLRLAIDESIAFLGMLPIIGGLISIVYATWGGIGNVRRAARQDDFINGYIAGRDRDGEQLLIGTDRNGKND